MSEKGSAVGSTGSAIGPRVKGAGGEDEELDRKASIEQGVFGVLFTLTKEKSDTIKFTIVKSLLDLDQLFITVVDPAQGWDIDPDHIIWRIVNVLNFQWVKDRGYNFFVALLYCMVGALAANLALCIWVAVAFQRRQFDHVWPVRVLRVFTSIFFQFFDVASLNLLQIALSCQYVGAPDGLQGRMTLFPDVECKSFPHLIHAIVSGVALVVFVLIALLLNLSEVELNPASKRPMALGSSGTEVLGFFIKFLMTMVSVIIPWNRVQGPMLSFLALWLTYITVRWVPNLVGWANHVKVAIYTSILYCALMLCLLAYHPGMDDMTDDFSHKVTVAMLAGLPALLIVGALISYFRIRLYCSKVQNKFMDMEAGTKLVDVYEFQNPRDVEIASRIMRRWEPKGKELLPEAVAEAEVILKAGLAMFPNDAYMSLIYANFMIEVGGNSSTGYRHLEMVGTQQPNVMCRFMVFVREQEQQQKSASPGQGGGTLDLLSYVEYQKNQRLVLRHHKEALMAVCNFWKGLNHSKIPFTKLSGSLHHIEKCMLRAEQAYKMALDRHPSSIKLLALYAKFLEHVKNDPWKAAEYYSEVEKLEEKQAEEGTTLKASDGETMKVDDKNNPVIVIDASGKMTMCNKAAHRVFGYEKGEMEGKQINMCMPQPFSIKHDSYLRHYHETGEERVMNQVRNVVVLHKDRYVFPARLLVTRAGGSGHNSTYMGVMEIPPRDEDTMTSHVWVTPNGVIVCIDAYFTEWFGHDAADMIGSPLHKYINVFAAQGESAEQMIMRLIDKTSLTNEKMLLQRQGSSANIMSEDVDVGVVHKYGDPMVCQLAAMAAGTPTTPIVQFMFKRSRAEGLDLMLVSDTKGQMQHISINLAAMLGYSNPQVALALKLQDLMMHPWNYLHPKWIKDQDEDAPPAPGCRAGELTVCMQDARGKPVPVRMSVRSSDESGNMLHIVHVKKASLVQAQLDRSLQLTVSSAGIITEVSEATPDTLFNIKPAELLGLPLDACLKLTGDPDETTVLDSTPDEFQGVVDNPDMPNVLKVLNAMVKKALKHSGQSWRVAVVPPGEEEDIRARTKDPLVVATLLTQVMQPAVMQVEVKRPSRKPPPAPPVPQGRRASQLIIPRQASSLQVSNPAQVLPPAPAEKHGRRNSVDSTGSVSIPVQSLMMRPGGLVMTTTDAVGGAAEGQDPQPEKPAEQTSQRGQERGQERGLGRTESSKARDASQLANALRSQKEKESGLMIKVTLWRADLLAGLLELDKDGNITSLLDTQMYPAGLLFGVAHNKMKGTNFTKYIKASNMAELISEPGEKKSALKMAATRNALGSLRRVPGKHVDGCPLSLWVQMLMKGGAGGTATLVVRLDRPSRGDRDVFQRLLTDGAASAYNPALALGGAAGEAPSVEGARSLGGRSIAHSMAGGDGGALRGIMRSISQLSRLSKTSRKGTVVVGEPGARVSNAGSLVPAPQAAGLEEGGDDDTPRATRRFRFAGGHQQEQQEPVRQSSKLQSADEGEDGDENDDDVEEAARRLGVQVDADDDGDDGAASKRSGRSGRSGRSALSRPKASQKGSDEDEDEEGEKVLTVAQERKLRNIASWVESSGAVYVNAATAEADANADVSARVAPEHKDSALSADPNGGVLTIRRLDMHRSQHDLAVPPVDVAGAVSSREKPRRRNSMDASPIDDAEGSPAPPLRFSLGGNESIGGDEAGKSKRSSSPQNTRAHTSLMVLADKASQPLDDVDEEGSDGSDKPKKPAGNAGKPPGSPPGKGGVGGGKRPPPPLGKAGGNMDDGMSEASSADSGQSGMSGTSGTSGFTDVDERADYRRAKRFKKLAGMLDSTQAQRVTQRFRQSAMGVVLGICALHVICFVVVIIFVNKQVNGIKNLFNTGHVCQAVMNIVIASRALDQLHKGFGSTELYMCSSGIVNTSSPLFLDCPDVQKYQSVLDEATTSFRTHSDEIYLASGSTGAIAEELQNLYDRTPLPVVVHWNNTVVTTTRSLWMLTNDIYDAGREVLQQHMTWASMGRTIGSSYEFNYLMENGPTTFFETYYKATTSMMELTIQNEDYVAKVMYILMAVEISLQFVATLFFAHLLTQVTYQRYSLYGVFLVIPQGLTRALATQTMQLLELDDGSDNEGGGVERGGDVDDAGDRDGPGDDEDGPVAGAGKKGGKSALAGRVSHAEEADEPSPGLAIKPNSNTAGKGSKGKPRRQDSLVAGPPKGLLSLFMCCGGCFGNGKSSAGAAGKGSSGGKRQLIYNGRDSWLLLGPLYVWAALVVIIYALSAVWLHAEPDAVVLNSVIPATYGSMLKTVLLAQELCRQGSDPGTSPTTLAERKVQLALAHDELNMNYMVLLRGEHAPNVTSVWTGVGEPVTNNAPGVSSLMFDTRDCLRANPDLCFETNSTYYEATHNGINTMVMRLLRETRELLQTPDSEIGGLANDHMAWIWNIGLKDLQDGLLLLADMHSGVSLVATQRVRTMQIVFLAIFLLLAVIYIAVFLKPNLKKMSHEKRRIAELLSQLPNELNVEKMVLLALGGGPAKKPRSNKVAPDGGPASPGGLDASKWSQIVKLQRDNSAAQVSLRLKGGGAI